MTLSVAAASLPWSDAAPLPSPDAAHARSPLSSTASDSHQDAPGSLSDAASAHIKRRSGRRANTAERRATHNAVERQRRETLNSRFLDLAALLPNLSLIRRPSKSSIVNSSIAHINASMRHRILAARELRLVKAEADALRREVNDWRGRANIPRVEEPIRSEGFSMVLSGELEVTAPVPGDDDEEEGDVGYSGGAYIDDIEPDCRPPIMCEEADMQFGKGQPSPPSVPGGQEMHRISRTGRSPGGLMASAAGMDSAGVYTQYVPHAQGPQFLSRAHLHQQHKLQPLGEQTKMALYDMYNQQSQPVQHMMQAQRSHFPPSVPSQGHSGIGNSSVHDSKMQGNSVARNGMSPDVSPNVPFPDLSYNAFQRRASDDGLSINSSVSSRGSESVNLNGAAQRARSARRVQDLQRGRSGSLSSRSRSGSGSPGGHSSQYEFGTEYGVRAWEGMGSAGGHLQINGNMNMGLSMGAGGMSMNLGGMGLGGPQMNMGVVGVGGNASAYGLMM